MKTIVRRLMPVLALPVLAMLPRLEAQSQASLSTLASFLGSGDGQGANPVAPLVQGKDGNFYGTTVNGGGNNDGSVFSVTTGGNTATLYSFQTVATDGETPDAPLIQGSDGAFYGTTQGSGSKPGTVFRITSAGDLATLYDFQNLVTDGSHPETPLIEDGDGNFYGTTSGGGSSANAGTFFKVTSAGKETILHVFSGSPDDGAGPIGPVVLGSDGNFYGTTFSGGANNAGTVYKMTPAGTVTILHGFTSGTGGDGSAVRGGLALGPDGAFYGTTETGGASNEGTVFKITSAGKFTSLHSFSAAGANGENSDGVVPYAGLSVGTDGNLYGATGGGGGMNAGTLFRITPAGVLTSLYSFSAPGSGFVNSDGATPYAPPIEGNDGNFYGTTYVGGFGGKGVVYQMKLAPVITSAATADAFVGKAFTYQIEAAFNPTSYTATGLPTGLSVNKTTGVISGTPTATGTKKITLEAANAIGTGEETLTLTISQAAAPVITGATTDTATTGEAFTYQITATNGPTSFNATGLPSGLSVNKTTGVISGTPASTAAGTKTLNLSAANAFGTGTATLTLDILATPVITSATTASATVGKAFSYKITASHDPASFDATGLPSGLSVNKTTGVISGTPASTASGTKTIHLTATNSAGSGTATLTLTIIGAPKITSAATASATAGKAFSYQITATNDPTSFNATGRPSGLTVDTETGLISGTPASTAVGTKTLTLSATNAVGTGEETLTLTITK